MEFSRKAFMNSKIIQSLLQVRTSNIAFKAIAMAIIWAIALIPTYIYLIARWITNAEGFWEELAVMIVCGAILGWIQLITLFVVIILSFKLIFEDF